MVMQLFNSASGSTDLLYLRLHQPSRSLAPFASIEMAVCVVKYYEQPIPILTDHFLLAALVLARS